MGEVIFDLPDSLGPDAESKLRDHLGLEQAPEDLSAEIVVLAVCLTRTIA